MKNKALITEILRDWYFIDSVLLNGHAKKIITEEKDYNEYVSIKHALLSTLHEFYNYIGYTPKDVSVKSDKMLQESAVQLAKKSKNISSRMIQENKFVNHMKKVLMNEAATGKYKDLKKLNEDIINTRFLKMSMDNMLMGVPVIEAKIPQKASDFNGQIFENSYMMMRSSLIDICKNYNPAFKKNVVNEIAIGTVARGIGLGLVALAGFKIVGSLARGIESFSNQCFNRCGTFRLNNTAKKICTNKCEIEVRKRIIAALRQSAAQTNNEAARDKYARDVRRAQLQITKYQRELAELQARNVGVNQNVEASATGARAF